LDPLGSHVAKQSITSNLGTRNLHRYEVFAEAGEIVTAIVTPINPNSILLINGNSAPASGQAAAYVTTTDSDGIVNLDITGTAATDYTMDVFLNTFVEAAGGDIDANSVLPLDDFLLPVGSGLVSVVGDATPMLSDEVVLSEDFASGLGGFVIDNDYERGGGLWHISTGRSQDGNPNHTPPNSLYYGKNENSTGGGNIDTGSPSSGAVESPSMDLPMSPNITLSFQYLSDRGNGQPSRDDVGQVDVDDGSGFVTILSTEDGSLTGNTEGQWRTATADLTAFAGSSIKLRFAFDTGNSVARNDEGWYVDDISILADEILIADTDAYTIDLSEHVGQSVDVVLAAIGGTELPEVLLELVDPTGSVAAIGTPMPLASPAEGFDMAILDYIVPDLGDNIYTVRIGSADPGEYGVMITPSMTFGIEPNEDAQDQRLIDASSFALGYLDIATDPSDAYLVSLPVGRPVLIRVATPLNHPRSQPENTLQTLFSFADPSAAPLPGFVERIDLPDMGIVLTSTETVNVQVGIAAESGLGEYLSEFDVAVLDGDFNDDGELSCVDLNALTSAMVTGEDLSFDVSADGLLDENDLLLWFVLASRANSGSGEIYRPGDANLDGTVDGLDFDIWSSNRFTLVGGWCNGDFNIDGQVDVSDFNIWNDNRFESGVAAASPPADIVRTPRAPAATPAVAVWRDVARSSFHHDFNSERLATEATDKVFERGRLVPVEWQNVQSEIQLRSVSRSMVRNVAASRGNDLVDASEAEQPLQTNIIDKVFSGWSAPRT
jgi:hypothetical protein